MGTADAEVRRIRRMAEHLERRVPAAAGTDPDLVEEWLALRPRLSPQALRAATPETLQRLARDAFRLIDTLASRRRERRARRVDLELNLLDPDGPL